jgi:hypothetical protein
VEDSDRFSAVSEAREGEANEAAGIWRLPVFPETGISVECSFRNGFLSLPTSGFMMPPVLREEMHTPFKLLPGILDIKVASDFHPLRD